MSTSNRIGMGRIVTVYPTPAPDQDPTTLEYDVEVVGEDGATTLHSKVRTALTQTNVNVIPAQPGTPCMVNWIDANTLEFLIVEPPYFAECTGQGGA